MSIRYVSELVYGTEMIDDTRESFVNVQLKAIEVAEDYIKMVKALIPDEDFKGYHIEFNAIDSDDYGKENDKGQYIERDVVSWRIEISALTEDKKFGKVIGIEEHTKTNVYVNGEKEFTGGYSDAFYWAVERGYNPESPEAEIELIEEQSDIYGLLDKLGGTTNENTISKIGELR